MAKGVLAAPVSVADVADSVYPLPGRSKLTLSNVAIPSTACTVVVPASVPPLGFAPNASDTACVAPGTVVPNAS